MRTLVVHGDWLLKRSHFENLNIRTDDMQKSPRGGIFGFIDKLRTIISDHRIDKVVIVWEGSFGGINKYDAYPILQAEKKRILNERMKILRSDVLYLTKKEVHEREINDQKMILQRLLDDLSIRQMEEEASEAVDGICLYVNEAITVGESIIIFGRENEFSQLISENTTTIGWDGSIVGLHNFFTIHGYDKTNDLMIKCFTGMPSSIISGVKGLTVRKMLRYFFGLKLEQYSYVELLSYARRKHLDVKLKVYEMVLSAHDVVARNASLINMKEPFFSSELNFQKNFCIYSPLNKDGFNDFKRNYAEIMPDLLRKRKDIFGEFQRIILKEQEYSLFHEQINI